mgnify:CR=1 FL=1
MGKYVALPSACARLAYGLAGPVSGRRAHRQTPLYDQCTHGSEYLRLDGIPRYELYACSLARAHQHQADEAGMGGCARDPIAALLAICSPVAGTIVIQLYLAYCSSQAIPALPPETRTDQRSEPDFEP